MSLHALRLKMIDLVRAGHVDRQEYELFASLAKANEAPTLPPMEYIDVDITAPVFKHYEQQEKANQSGFERI